MQKLKALKNKVGKYEGLVTTYEDILTLIEMGIEEQDDSVYEEVKEMNDSFLAEYEALRIATMLDGEYDRNNAIVTLHAGTGGTEACDWTNMLFRMYSRWAQKEGFEVRYWRSCERFCMLCWRRSSRNFASKSGRRSRSSVSSSLK